MNDNFDVKWVGCFGNPGPRGKSWASAFSKTQLVGDLKKFEKNLADNVEASYYSLGSVGLTDLDSNTEYSALFDNGKKEWYLAINDSPEAEITKEEYDKIFGSDTMKKLLARFKEVLDLDVKRMPTVLEAVKTGDMIEVDETKLEAIDFFLKDKMLVNNLTSGKHTAV